MYQKIDGTLLKTKIIATVGAARDGVFDSKKKPFDSKVSNSTILDMFRQENAPYYMVDIIRINMSFYNNGEQEREVFEWIQKNRESCAKNVALLADLPGPKIRLDPKKYTDVELKKGDSIEISFGDCLEGSDIPCVLVSDEPFPKMVKKIGEPDNPKIGVFDKFGNYIRKKLNNGEEVTLIIGDGIVVFNAIAENKGVVTCIVEKGGKIPKKKGLTIKKASLEVPPFFERPTDKKALNFLLDHGKDLITHIGVSFVNDENDILQVKYYIEKKIFERLKKEYHDADPEILKKDFISIQNCTEEIVGKSLTDNRRLAILWEEARLRSPAVIAKIETQKAEKNIESIMDVADGIMIARGDLALQLDPQDVPPIQKRIIRLCNHRGKPVITATEMLNSMKDNPYPTRAEATDVFNAILDGSTAVMLSNETSEGVYPFQAVHMMAQIAEKAEKHLEKTHLTDNLRKKLNRQRFQEIVSGSASLLKSHEERLKEKNYKYSKMIEDFKKKKNGERPQKEERIKFYSWIRDYYSQKGAKTSKQITTDSISESACIMAEEKKYEAIIVSTITGRTAHMIARFRPSAKIIPVVHDEFNTRKMILSYGSYPLNIELINKKTCQIYQNTDEIYEQSICLAQEKKLVRCRDMVIFVAGTPLWVLGEANLIQIKTVEDNPFSIYI